MPENLIAMVARFTGIGAKASPRIRTRETHLGDQIFHFILKLIAWSMIILVLGIIYLLLDMAWPAFQRFGPGFFGGTDWNPPMEIFGALPFIFGTVVTSLVALCLAAP